jgi:hypothetical protein
MKSAAKTVTGTFFRLTSRASYSILVAKKGACHRFCSAPYDFAGTVMIIRL